MAAAEVRYAVADPSTPPPGLYAMLCAAFDEPPYENVPALMAKRLAAWPDFARSNGFRVVTAHRGSELVGVCFGFVDVLGTADEPALWAGLYERLRAAPFHDELRGAEIVEFATARAVRGRGVGQRLVDTFLDGRPGWLLAESTAPAYGWYLRHGWRVLGPPHDATAYVVLARDATVER